MPCHGGQQRPPVASSSTRAGHAGSMLDRLFFSWLGLQCSSTIDGHQQGVLHSMHIHVFPPYCKARVSQPMNCLACVTHTVSAVGSYGAVCACGAMLAGSGRSRVSTSAGTKLSVHDRCVWTACAGFVSTSKLAPCRCAVSARLAVML
jgi:hypothetical protein